MASILQRLREPPFGTETSERNLFNAAADRIERIERELDQWRVNYGKLGLELAAEKALADQYKDALSNISAMGFSDDPAVAANIARYAVEMARKARGL